MTNYGLVMIKPLSVGRGHAYDIIARILNNNPVTLRMIRSWRVCDTTWKALSIKTAGIESCIDYATESIHTLNPALSVICIFTHIDRVSDPIPILENEFGPQNRSLWLPHHLRYAFSVVKNNTAHASDTIVHMPVRERTEYESSLLLINFDSSSI